MGNTRLTVLNQVPMDLSKQGEENDEIKSCRALIYDIVTLIRFPDSISRAVVYLFT